MAMSANWFRDLVALREGAQHIKYSTSQVASNRRCGDEINIYQRVVFPASQFLDLTKL